MEQMTIALVVTFNFSPYSCLQILKCTVGMTPSTRT